MDLSPYVESIRRDLSAAAEVAGEDARAAAERMVTALDPAVRLALLDALTDASAEITRELAPGAVELRLRARDPEFAVTPPDAGFDDETGGEDVREGEEPRESGTGPPDAAGPADVGTRAAIGAEPSAPPGATDPSASDDGGTARITLRMPESLKNRVEESADADGLSVNQWLIRAAASVLAEGSRGRNRDGAEGRGRSGRIGRTYRGWAR